MKLEYLGIPGIVVACGLLAGSCSLDERNVSLSDASVGSSDGLPADGLQPGAGGTPGNTNASAGGSLLSVPQLVVRPAEVDLGRVTAGFAARARVRVENAGMASLPVPAVRFAQGSHADFSLIQNECTSALAPGQACELRVQLVATEPGPRAGTLEVTSEVGGSASVAFNALGLAAGDLILAPVAGSFENFGEARVGATLEGAFSISNPSDVASGPLTFFVNRPDFQVLAPGDGDCVPGMTSLVAGQSCTVRVAFTPNERGPIEATLTGGAEGVGAVSVTLSGRGLLPAVLGTSATTVDFNEVVVLSSARRNIRFENAGDEPLTLAGARLLSEGAEGFSILSSDCAAGTPLEGGRACLVQLEFRPPRVGEEMTAELVVEGAEQGQSQSIALRGIGLEQGALLVAEQTPGEADFGDVLLGESSEHTFQIQNPSAQQSGGLEFHVSEGFELATPPLPGECVPGSTSLVNGETCPVRVRFVPSSRESFSGSLTVSSPLAGARDLALLGRGIAPATLRVDREVNFGRVLTGPPGQSRTLSIENAGDEPLQPPALALTGSSPAQVAAFASVSQCAAALAFGERCDVTLTFAPAAAGAHAVTLEIGAAGGRANVLLLGDAQLPGTLVAAAAAGSSTDFGDVPVGSSVARTFTLQNPGQVPSGSVTIVSDNNRFEPNLGDCNPGDPAGLDAGASCTFSVSFAPNDNLPQVANLSVQSPGAGRTSLLVSGLGRLPAALSSTTGNRDLGRAYIGDAAPALSEFSWVINNQGDLPTGTLALQNDNPTEFSIRNDTCSNASIPARSSCEMIIRFVPGVPGNRTGRIVVDDPTNARSVTLALTGLGVQLADLGEACVNADCAQGTCTRGVCCDVPCDRTCQVCSAEGRCIDQTNREACGNGAACFGVDNCKLPEGRACSAIGGDAQCGSGQCERRLGGSGNNDRICCLEDCGNNLQCNAQNRCQAPALGDGDACGAAGQPACAPGLACRACVGGGNRCTPLNECCGGCGGSAPACDTQAGVCRQCVQAADCPVGPTGTFRSCTNFTCRYACSTQQGFKECNGACIPDTQCCTPADCNGGQCVGGQCQQPAILVATPAVVQYGSVPVGVGQTDRSVTITNTGGQASGQVNITESETGATFAFATNNCPFPLFLAPGASCELSVLGFVVSQTGPIESALNVAGGAQTLRIPLRATGTAALPNLIQSSPMGSTFDMGVVVEDTQSTVTWIITNTGDSSTGALPIIINGDAGFTATPATCPALSPTASCSVTIGFTPVLDLQPGQRVPFESTFTLTGFPNLVFTVTAVARPPFGPMDP